MNTLSDTLVVFHEVDDDTFSKCVSNLPFEAKEVKQRNHQSHIVEFEGEAEAFASAYILENEGMTWFHGPHNVKAMILPAVERAEERGRKVVFRNGEITLA